jgi:SAM-dependent methyltransferase
MPESADIAIRHTLRFVEAHLPGRTSGVLEVGCGEGRLAAALAAAGYRVTAIDRDPDAVAGARGRGVEAIEATWPEFDGGPFDAILFVRSLHHIGSLDEAVARAAELLAQGGRVIVEDFDFVAANEETVGWLLGAARALAAAGRLRPPEGGLVARLLGGGESLAEWRGHHLEHGVHAGDVMLAAMVRRLHLVHESDSPYLYRYLAAAMSADGGDVVAAAVRDEADRIERGVIRAVGRRFVGVRRTQAANRLR